MRFSQYAVFLILLFLIIQVPTSNAWVKCECGGVTDTYCAILSCPASCRFKGTGLGNKHRDCVDLVGGARTVGHASNGDPIRACLNNNSNYKVGIVGNNADIVWVYSSKNQNIQSPSHKDYIRDGNFLRCNDDINFGNNYIVVRHGSNRDLIRMYGIKSDGNIVQKGFRLQDGSHHGVALRANQFVVVFGREKDLSIRFCFNGKSWTRSSRTRGTRIPPVCSINM